LSQSTRVDAEDEAGSDDDRSLPEDSASDSDNVSHTVPLALRTALLFRIY